MPTIKDLITKPGSEIGLAGVGASVWYAEVIPPVPVVPGGDLFVTIPDLNLGTLTKWGPVNWGGRQVPLLGDGLIVAFDNRQQLWALLAIADTATRVTSWNARTGAVVPANGDYSVSQITGAAPLASPALTGVPTAPTPATSDSSTKIATTSYVKAQSPVTSVFGRGGAVVAAAGDYDVSQITGAAPLTRTPKITSSVFSGGPPASPADGDIWIATGIGNGVVWQFRYNAGSASTYKWEFIGGSKVNALVYASEGTASAAYTDLATVGPSITVARAGDYWCGYGGTASNNTVSAGAFINITAGATPDDNYLAYMLNSAGAVVPTTKVPLWKEAPLLGVAAGGTIKHQYAAFNGGTALYDRRELTVQPIRVS